MDEEFKKAHEKFVLMVICKMTITEINTLSDNERFYLYKYFIEKYNDEKKII